MKKILAFLLATALGASNLWATEACDYEDITVTTSSAIGLTASKLNSTLCGVPVRVFITLEDEDVRFRVDGGTPTSTVGHKLVDGDSVNIDSLSNLYNLRMISIGSGSATARVTYER